MIKKKSITIINRHYPPNPGITGESAWDLAKYLLENHHFEVKIVCLKLIDDGGGAQRIPIGEVHYAYTIYTGKNKFLKSFSGFFDGFFLIIKALKVKKGVVVCMTSPPMLPLWASLIFGFKNIGWVLWSMDLFPEFFAASGKANKNSFIYKSILKLNYQLPPKSLIALGINQAKFLESNYKKTLHKIILPCGVFIDYQASTSVPEWRQDSNKIYFGYCGNLGLAHNEFFLKSFIDSLNPFKHTLILAIYGPKANDIIAYADGKKGVVILENVPRVQLHFIDVHLVSLKKDFTHISIPSKAITSICVGCCVLFCGSQFSDSWEFIKNASWYIDENDTILNQIEYFLNNIDIDNITMKKDVAKKLAADLFSNQVKAYDQIAELGNK